MPINTPVLFCVYNRPEVTQQVYARIAAQRPAQLFVACDGPRPERSGDGELVARVRQIVSGVDWDCDLRTDFSEINLGCRQRMNSAIDWAFRYTDELIILEDDCLPEPCFFEYCRRLLDRYRDEPRVMMISGDNFQPRRRTRNSYYFSRYAHIWGWATWRRAWRNCHDPAMTDWPQAIAEGWIEQIGLAQSERQFWFDQFQQQYCGEVDTWDFAWQYSIWRAGGLIALPQVNLISNLGFHSQATHTHDPQSPLAALPTSPLAEWQHPAKVQRDEAADDWTWHNVFSPVGNAHGDRQSGGNNSQASGQCPANEQCDERKRIWWRQWIERSKLFRRPTRPERPSQSDAA